MYEHPILVDQAGKALLGLFLLYSSLSRPLPCLLSSLPGMTVWNDSLFLSSLNVMDYSLIVGLDDSGQLIVGIIGMEDGERRKEN
jgi:hypothetical protein